MPKKIDLSENGLYLCGACNRASNRVEWVELAELPGVYTCPLCGTLIRPDVKNVMEEGPSIGDDIEAKAEKKK